MFFCCKLFVFKDYVPKLLGIQLGASRQVI
uniref:Uncharacterized protein n=1 Tax=Arundo donax TaxID=35708 RepID=A0A0A9BN97_ARUDO